MKNNIVNDANKFNRGDFMSFFRDSDSLNTLSNDDRLEIFSYILAGESDLTKELLESIICDYSQGTLIVNEVENG